MRGKQNLRPAEEKRCRCHRLQHTPSNAAKSTPWAVAPPCRLPRPRRRCRPRHRRRGHRRRGHRRRYQRRRDQRRRGRRLLLLLLLAIAAAASSRSSLLPAAAPPPPAAAAASSAALAAAPPPPAQPVAGGARTHGTLAHHTVLTCMSPHVLAGRGSAVVLTQLRKQWLAKSWPAAVDHGAWCCAMAPFAFAPMC